MFPSPLLGFAEHAAPDDRTRPRMACRLRCALLTSPLVHGSPLHLVGEKERFDSEAAGCPPDQGVGNLFDLLEELRVVAEPRCLVLNNYGRRVCGGDGPVSPER